MEHKIEIEDFAFDESTHTYTLNGKTLISVTQLMEKHHLSPSYEGVDEELLKASAERGKLIHKDIEEYNKKGLGGTDECRKYADYLKEHNVVVLGSEVAIHNDIVAGTYDLFIDYEDKGFAIADIKTTSTLHKEAVSWQLSIYAYLLGGDIEHGQVFWFNKEGDLEVVDIPLKPEEEVIRLMECERQGLPFTQELVDMDNELAVIYEAEQIITRAKREQKEAEARQKAVYEAIMRAMEEKGMKTFETDNLKITYVAPTTRVTIDTKKLQAENPLVAKAYERTSEVKATLKITLKGEDE